MGDWSESGGAEREREKERERTRESRRESPRRWNVDEPRRKKGRETMKIGRAHV